ncbi:MAG: ketoacyl-ACP synthase III [Actinomycetota bacterium]|nr:ketoacyl-ACP synthase III [Actinomycetota bacterium]
MTAVLEGLGVAVPQRVVSNHDLEGVLDTSDEWIRTRTGIAERRVAEPGVATADLAVEAGARALKSAGGGPVDMVVVATTSPDRLVPATAPEVASRIGLEPVAAFDLNAVCSGFVYALAVAAGMLDGRGTKRVMVIGAETLSRITDPADRSTAVLFGDGGGAAVLRRGDPDEPGAFGPFDLGSDGSMADSLAMPAGGSRRPASASTVTAREHYMRLDGKAVYRHAIARMVASSQAALHAARLSAEDVDRFVGHQANLRILDAVADRLGIAPQRRVVNVDRYGNTSAASIPLALADAELAPGQRVLLTAFGGGFTWGSTTLTWPRLATV